jgi:hypothetical protein
MAEQIEDTHYKLGQFFVLEPDGALYMLAMVTGHKFVMVCLNDGQRWEDAEELKYTQVGRYLWVPKREVHETIASMTPLLVEGGEKLQFIPVNVDFEDKRSRDG